MVTATITVHRQVMYDTHRGVVLRFLSGQREGQVGQPCHALLQIVPSHLALPLIDRSAWLLVHNPHRPCCASHAHFLLFFADFAGVTGACRATCRFAACKP